MTEMIMQQYGPAGVLVFAFALLSWRLYRQIESLKEASFKGKLDEQDKRITTVENTLAAAERALIKLGVWRE